MSYAAKCATCAAADLCSHTFKGRLHNDKSHGGVGCDHPIIATADHIRAMHMAKAMETADETARDAGGRSSAAPKQPTLWHKYIVTHRLIEYPTVAHSPEQAINFIRFKLYGARPADTLPPFTVRLADNAQTKTDGRTGSSKHLSLDAIRSRLTRMTS